MPARAIRPLDRAAPAASFASALRGYWASVFPRVCHELRRWRERAAAIQDPVLRDLAAQGLAKRGNVEGAAAFATFAPRRHRAAVVQATVAYQAAYDYLDVLSEQPNPRPARASARLHEALLAAVDPSRPHQDYYDRCDVALGGAGDDGYLMALVEACRAALLSLPSYPLVASTAQTAAERGVRFQTFNAAAAVDGYETMERWASEQTPVQAILRWWEIAAACGSSMGVHAMIAAAGEPDLSAERVLALERAYLPWTCALHSLLDQLVDVGEDSRAGQRNLIGLYASSDRAAERMGFLAERALASARTLGPAHRHELIVAAMASFYLSAPEARIGEAAPVASAVLEVLGPLARPALAVFKTRRAVERVYYACRANGHHRTAAEPLAFVASHR